MFGETPTFDVMPLESSKWKRFETGCLEFQVVIIYLFYSIYSSLVRCLDNQMIQIIISNNWNCSMQGDIGW